MKIIAEQLDLRRELTVVVGNVDYEEFLSRLEWIDMSLRVSGLEDKFIEMLLAEYERAGMEEAVRSGHAYKPISGKEQSRYQRMCRKALRCNIARQLTEKEYRAFSRRLAESALLQKFCMVDRLEVIRVPTKSTLERYDKLASEKDVRALVNQLSGLVMTKESESIGLENCLDIDSYFSDTTCVKANIHFPVDWVLLRDAVKTLIKAIMVIRRHGLKCRIPDPEGFVREINHLSIEMAHARRKEDSQKTRKRVLRKMKKLCRLVRMHATRYHDALDKRAEETDLKEGEKRQILKRLNSIIKQLPAAIKQAHERIIGGRQVKNSDKILSLYDPDIHVIVRKKAEAEVEFGNTLFLGEQRDGLVIDWKLLKDQTPGDPKLLKQSLSRIHGVFGRYPSKACGDRGFQSQDNGTWLEKEGIYDGTCPRNPHELKMRMKDKDFVELQKRRGQTEGRIGIIKNDFLGRPLRSKGIENRELAVAWAVMAHNLWLIAGLVVMADKEKKKAA